MRAIVDEFPDSFRWWRVLRRKNGSIARLSAVCHFRRNRGFRLRPPVASGSPGWYRNCGCNCLHFYRMASRSLPVVPCGTQAITSSIGPEMLLLLNSSSPFGRYPQYSSLYGCGFTSLHIVLRSSQSARTLKRDASLHAFWGAFQSRAILVGIFFVENRC